MFRFPPRSVSRLYSKERLTRVLWGQKHFLAEDAAKVEVPPFIVPVNDDLTRLFGLLARGANIFTVIQKSHYDCLLLRRQGIF